MTEIEERAAVVAEARTWLRTPWAHAADVRGAGVDCGMLLIRAFADSGVIPGLPDPRPYKRHWYLHRDDDRYLRFLRQFGTEFAGTPPQTGDVVAWKTGKTYGHAAIVTRWPAVIHAFWPDRMVVESDVEAQGPLAGLERKFFTRWPA